MENRGNISPGARGMIVKTKFPFVSVRTVDGITSLLVETLVVKKPKTKRLWPENLACSRRIKQNGTLLYAEARPIV